MKAGKEMLRVVLDKKQVIDACAEYARFRVSLPTGTFKINVLIDPAQAEANATVVFSEKRVRKAKAAPNVG